MKVKYILWKLGLYKKCPNCDAELWETGYPASDGRQYYKGSSESCNFGKDRYDK